MTDISDLKTDGFWYLASPYSHTDKFIQGIRARRSNDYAGALLRAGVYVHQPIWSTHRIGERFELPGDHLFWLGFNKAFIDPSVGMIMCDIEGWQQSKGCQQEIEYVRSLNKPIWLYNGLTKLTAL